MSEGEAAKVMVEARSDIHQVIEGQPVGDRREWPRRVIGPGCGRTFRWRGPTRHPSRGPEGVPSPNWAPPHADWAFDPHGAVFRGHESIATETSRDVVESRVPHDRRSRSARGVRPVSLGDSPPPSQRKHPNPPFGQAIPSLVPLWCRRSPPLVGNKPLLRLVSRDPFPSTVHWNSLRWTLQGRLPVAGRFVLAIGPSLPSACMPRIPARDPSGIGAAASWATSWPSDFSKSASKTSRNPGHSWPQGSGFTGLELERKRARDRGGAGGGPVSEL